MRIEGRNAVTEAIAAGKTIDKLTVAKGLKDPASNRVINAARDAGVRVFFKEKDALDKESKTGRHQGFIAEVTDFGYCEVEDILNTAKSKGEDLFVILLDGVEDPHNMGSILRVAECAGVHGVIIPERRSVSVNDTVVRVSAGAAAHVKVAKAVNLNDVIREFKKDGVKVVAAEVGGKPVYETDLTGPLALVVGGEDSGVKRLTRELCDSIVTLPMFGKVNSLNASVSCGAVVYEAIRQRNKG
ncbi:MAG: 23S rRNA (guanosine(2251)-2'-O)-methyltransferase RlmB [Firmicutes bacterium]|nr:23S rRNA (guanosine(2251)-2'-O)-methyltransferase RlmB [Bacillota bacterium]